MILDFHTHVFPDSLAEIAINAMYERSPHIFYTDATASALKASMREADITHSVICNIAVKQGQTASIVEFAANMMKANPPSEPQRLIPLASVHPYEEESVEWLSKIKAAGFAGIKLHPDYQGFYINDPDLEPFYKEAVRLGLSMLFHAGVDAGYPEPVHATPERILDVLPVFEKGKVIIAHLGGYKMQDKSLEMLCGHNVYFDTAYILDKIPIEQVREIISRHSPGRILFASDSPWTSQKYFVGYFKEKIAKGFLSDGDSENILWRNGAGLLGL